MTLIIDLSTPLTPRDKSRRPPTIQYVDHEASAGRSAAVYGINTDDFREGRYAAIEHITLTTHDTTHMDAPWHYHPTSEGKPAKTIDEIPLEWCYGDGLVLDFHHKKAGDRIDAEDIQKALDALGYSLKPFDIVLIRTDAYLHREEEGFENVHPGVTRDGTLYLIDHGIKVMGIDAWGWDRSLDAMIRDLKAGDSEQFWESHYLGKEKEYCHLERLAHLDKIPFPFGFKVAVFPVTIEGASAGWVRAVAIID
ncbi:MAG TPA: cyclase family protein [Desulfobacteraceae bacterium]|nr:cyclase family protein [Desulfobacteraceae bacterium]